MRKIFKRGLITLIPISITIAFLIWFFSQLERFFSTPIKWLIGSEYYFPGLSLFFSLALIFITGILINTWLVKKIYLLGEKILKKIPIIKSIYFGIRDVMKYFQAAPEERGKVVAKIHLNECDFLGFITRETFEEFPQIASDQEVAVFLPMSYQIGGYMVLISKSHITPLDLPIGEAMRFIMTAGAKNKEEE